MKRYGLSDDLNFDGNELTFPAQSSVLDEYALLPIIRKYNIPLPESCQFFARGDADIYLVKTLSTQYYLKIYRPPQSLEQTETEGKFVSCLSNSGLSVVKPISRQDGHYSCQVMAPEGSRPMLLFEEAPPSIPLRFDEAFLEQFGEKVASLHSAADRLCSKFNVHVMVTRDYLDEQVYYISHFLSRKEKTYIQSISKNLSLFLGKLPRSLPEFGLCHSDLVISNIRQTPNGTITLFDFGNLSKTWRSYELAVIYWSLQNRNLDDIDHLWNAFLKGYGSVRLLPESLSEHIPVMLILRQISFLGGNCATLPLRLGIEPIVSGFIKKEIRRLKEIVNESGLLNELLATEKYSEY